MKPYVLSQDEKEQLHGDLFNFTKYDNVEERIDGFTGKKSSNKTLHEDSTYDASYGSTGNHGSTTEKVSHNFEKF